MEVFLHAMFYSNWLHCCCVTGIAAATVADFRRLVDDADLKFSNFVNQLLFNFTELFYRIKFLDYRIYGVVCAILGLAIFVEL